MTAPLVACHRDKGEKATKAASTKSPAELKRITESAKQSLEGLKAPMAELNAKVTALHEQFDNLPPDLPEFGETRSKFYTASVAVGTLSAKLPWLANRLSTAEKSGNADELEEVSKDISHTYDEIRQAEGVSLELLHRVMPFQRMAAEIAERGEQRRAAGQTKCE